MTSPTILNCFSICLFSKTDVGRKSQDIFKNLQSLVVRQRKSSTNNFFTLYRFWLLKVQLCKLYNNKYIITSTQTRNTEIFAFTALRVFKLLTRKILLTNRKDNRNCEKVGHFLRKCKLLQDYKLLECEIFRILLKGVSNHLSVLFQYAWL